MSPASGEASARHSLPPRAVGERAPELTTPKDIDVYLHFSPQGRCGCRVGSPRHCHLGCCSRVRCVPDCVFAESPHKFLRGYSDYRVEEEFTVPANVHRIRFDIFGGGGVSDTGHESGSGARAIGIVEVKPGQTVRVIAGGGSGDARTPYLFGLKTGGPARGGRGYGDGGDAPRFTMPAEVVAEVTKRYPGALTGGNLKTVLRVPLKFMDTPVAAPRHC